MVGQRSKLPAIVAGLTLVLACASSTVESGNLLFQVTGTFQGNQSGTANGVAFQDEQIVFLLIEQGDSVTGTYDVTGLLGGNFFGVIDQAVSAGTFIDFIMEQVDPCAGSFAGRAEARSGVGISGNVTVALAGSYDGTDCDGDVDADFFVQN